ncbi:unnamed protein product [Callosobruchus maculatus]|uniref:Ig-like domain-containing protein n=1 Tax=Callosobruchus maculatus TaxID=64391 RepID=A0A653CII2_CALMS|nr:unnamed protein product [Callosobruchus maculatus]
MPDLTADIKAIVEWGLANKVQFNVQKTQATTLTKKSHDGLPTVEMEGHPIVESPSVKLLGININNNISWHDHVVSIANTASQKLGVSFRCRKLYTPEQLLLLYKAQIRPLLEYYSHVWGCAPKHSLKLLDTIQKKAIRLIDTPNLTKDLHSLEHRRRVAELSLFYRFYHGRCSNELSQIITPQAVRTRETREALRAHPYQVEVLTPRTSLLQHSFFWRTSTLWNQLPGNLFPDGYNLQRFKSNDAWSMKRDPDQEIKCRIEQARITFLKLKKFLTDKNLNFSLRYRMVKCYVWSVLLYGMEAWTLKATTINKIEAFEMWILRRMLKIPWVDHVTNEEVLPRAELTDRQLFDTIKTRKIAYLGHVIQGERYQLQRLVLQDTPVDDPVMVVDKEVAEVGSVIKGNCSAPASYPPANVTWYLNGRRWLNSLLNDRYLFVVVEGCSSDVFSINAGVPQGSVLSPPLFLLYINELLKITSSSTYSFADDSTIMSCMKLGKPLLSQETVLRLQQHALQINVDIKTIVEWGLVNKVQFNVQKTQATTLTKKSHVGLPAVEMEGQPIVKSPSFKLLGININNNMSWHDHVVSIAKTASQKLEAIYIRATTVALQLTDLTIIEVLLSKAAKQKRAIRLVDTPDLTKNLHSLERRRWVADLSLFYTKDVRVSSPR